MGCASQPTGRGSLEQIHKEKRPEWALSLFNTTPGTNYSLQIRTKTHYWTASILGKTTPSQIYTFILVINILLTNHPI